MNIRNHRMWTGLFFLGLSAAAAPAASVTDLIGIGGDIFLSDENGEQFIDHNNNGVIDAGDEFRGVLTFDQFRRNNEPQQPLLHSVGNSEVGGIFAVEVISKSPSAIPGRWNYNFAPVASFEATWGSGTIMVLWEDSGLSHFQIHDAVSQAAAQATVTDGNLFMKLGIVDGNDAWRGQGPENPNDLGSVSTRLLEFFFALTRTSTDGVGGTWALENVNSTAGVGEFVGSMQVGGTFDGSPWDLSSEASAQFRFTPIPAPAALSAGLLLMSLVAFRRQR